MYKDVVKIIQVDRNKDADDSMVVEIIMIPLTLEL